MGVAWPLESSRWSITDGRVFIARKMLQQINQAGIYLIKKSSNPFSCLIFYIIPFYLCLFTVFLRPINFRPLIKFTFVSCRCLLRKEKSTPADDT
jgi:hypothetical protein